MLLFSMTVLQNYPLFKYSNVTREKEIKQKNKDNNPKVDQPKNRRKGNTKDSSMPFMSATLALTKSVTKFLKKYWMKKIQ